MHDRNSGADCITRALVGLAGLSILVSLGSCAATPSQVEISDWSHVRVVPEGDAGRLTQSLEQLLVSCSVDSTGWVATEDKWRQALSGPHILARYAEHRSLHVAGRLVSSDEILLPLPPDNWPDHVLVRNAQLVLAFTKYIPERLADLVCDDGLGLEGHPQFKWLCENLQPR